MSVAYAVPSQAEAGALFVKAHTLPAHERQALVISSCVVDGQVVILSRYGDDVWLLVRQPTNKQRFEQQVNFRHVPPTFRAVIKEVVYRYMRRGRVGQRRPSDRAVVKMLQDALPFLRYLERRDIFRLAEVTPEACGSYVESCRRHRWSAGGAEKHLKPAALGHRFGVVEALYELSQFASDAMPNHPWPDTSSTHLAGLTGRGTGDRGGATPLMPDDVFSTLFQKAWAFVEGAPTLLELRDSWLAWKDEHGKEWSGEASSFELKCYVKKRGWSGAQAFNRALKDLRTACYVVVASLSGCRNHELAFIESGNWYCTESSVASGNGEIATYWWMRSQSTKTGEGRTEWMIPEAAVTALRIMEHWAKPYQEQIDGEIDARRVQDPRDPEIAEAQRHRHALFLGIEPRRSNQVRTLSGQMMNISLKAFARQCGLSWELATHHFRRKFANYAARSQFGDLRYLKQHFKHWSMVMTLGYALNESQEMALYAEIQDELDDIKAGVVEAWMRASTPLAGGYGASIVAWRGTNPVTLFKDHKHMVRSLAESTPLRSNGHAWCTADDNGCIGNDIERTRCNDCSNAVIGPRHARIYRGLYQHLSEVFAKCDDIGEGGQARVLRDMDRCGKILEALGEDMRDNQ